MASTFSADVSAWTERAKRNADLILRASVQDLGTAMTQTVPGKTRGGTLSVGNVPVDTGELVNSHQLAINGGRVSAGPTAYSGTLTGLKLGDTVEGAFTASHARPVEYGYTTSRGTQVPGWFFVRGAVQQWQAIVDRNAKALGE